MTPEELAAPLTAAQIAAIVDSQPTSFSRACVRRLAYQLDAATARAEAAEQEAAGATMRCLATTIERDAARVALAEAMCVRHFCDMESAPEPCDPYRYDTYLQRWSRALGRRVESEWPNPGKEKAAETAKLADAQQEVNRLQAVIRQVFSWEPSHEHENLDTIGHAIFLSDESRETILDVLRAAQPED